MNWDAWLPVLVVSSSLLPGLVIFFLREGSHRSRTGLNLAGAILKLVLVGILYFNWDADRTQDCINTGRTEAECDWR